MIWVTGSSGMLGSELYALCAARGIGIFATDREVDITDRASLESFAQSRLDRVSLDWIINCAAWTAVDRAEDEVEACFRVNARGPATLGAFAAARGARVLHLSTDYVFGGSLRHEEYQPRREDDPVDPMSVYGRSKAEGEAALLAALPEALVLRTAWLYGQRGPSFVHTMLSLMATKDRIRVVDDQWGSPTWTADLARAIADIIATPQAPAGIFHYSGEGRVSWYGFAKEIQRQALHCGLLTRECPLEPIPSSEYPTKALRPGWSVLSKEKIVGTFGLSIPRWEASLEAFLRIEAGKRRKETVEASGPSL